MKTIINDLKDQVTRMDRHREDIDWQRKECILLRVGLQENKDRTPELTIQGQQMSRWCQADVTFYHIDTKLQAGMTKYRN